MLLKKLNKSEEKVLQLQECETPMKEENKALLERLSKIECNMEDTLILNAKLQDSLESLVEAHYSLFHQVMYLEGVLSRYQA